MYSTNMRMPGEGRSRSRRAPFGLLLCVLLPPLGLMFLWRKGIFRTRGRMLITGLAMIEMAVITVLVLPDAPVNTVTPPAGVPALVTAAPESEVLTALYNIDQILREEQIRQALENGGTEQDVLSEQERTEQERLEQEAILNTIVYSVYQNAKYYHTESVCGTQSNRRALTVAEARMEGLGACANCDPPVYTGS